ncbi:MAG: hypothetical protein OXI40_13330 [Chloroflexota bacterium]|nr:hypothetical protein [Chloroflexota bacterium]
MRFISFLLIITVFAIGQVVADEWEIVVSDAECELWTLLKYHDIAGELCTLASVLSDFKAGLYEGLNIAFELEAECAWTLWHATNTMPEIDPVTRAIRDDSSPLIVDELISESLRAELGRLDKNQAEALDELWLRHDKDFQWGDFDGFCADLVMLTHTKSGDWFEEHFRPSEWVSPSSYGDN